MGVENGERLIAQLADGLHSTIFGDRRVPCESRATGRRGNHTGENPARTVLTAPIINIAVQITNETSPSQVAWTGAVHSLFNLPGNA